jgi:hypothetical protein
MKRAEFNFQIIGKLLAVFAWLSISTLTAYAQVTQVTATVTDDTTNYTSKYEVSFQISNGNNNSLVPADNDQVFIDFPAGTILPSSISTSNITIEGTNPSSNADITINGQTLAVTVPILVNGKGNSNDRTVNVVISKSAGIRNPSTNGDYTLNAYTTPENTPQGSNLYTIFQSTSQVSQAAVTPSPSVADRSAQYSIGFQTGPGGYLPSSSTITIDFPASTNIPGGSLSGVTLNGTSVSAIGDATNTSIDITTSAEISSNGTVNIVIGEGTGLNNPPAGTYSLDVSTSAETTPTTSSSYFISNPEQLSFSAVTLSNDTVNAVSEYQIDFIVGDPNGALSATNGDRIIFTFNDPTSIPSSIAAGNITVINQANGFSNNPSSVTVTDYTDSTHVSFATPIDIGDGEGVRVIFDQNAGIQNSPLTGSNYMAARTTESGGATINEYTQSNAFNTASTTTSITQPTVSLTNTSGGQTSDYTINFNVGKYGRLLGGTSTIDLVFPAGTDLTGITGVSVNSQSTTSSVSSQTLTVDVPTAVTVQNNGSVTLAVNGITNPAENTYSIETSTSVETNSVLSQSYEISNSQITVTSTTIGTPTVNNASSFSFNFSGASKLTSNNSDFVELTFPVGTELPASIANGDVTVGNQSVNSVVVDQSNRIVKVYIGSNNKAPNSITIAAAAGITHPSVPGSSYQVLVATSLDAPGTSSSYTLSGNATSVTAGTVTATPSTQGATNVEYDIPFTTGANGRLEGGTAVGSSTITIRFNNASNSTILPGSINANDVTVNGSTSGGVSITGNEITVTVPNGMVIGNSSTNNVVFSSAAGFDNDTPAGNYTVEVKTSSETVYSTDTNNLTLTTAVGLALNSVSRSSAIVNAPSSYTIKFTPGTGNGLDGSAGDNITLTFPDNTYIPPTVAKSNVLIEGVSPSVNPTVDYANRTLTVQLPSSVTIAAETQATMQISSSTGILNPTKVGSSYTLDLATNKESAVTSNSFSTTSATSTTSAATVSLGNNTPGATNQYTVTFNTGTYGRLIESGGALAASTISVKFPTGTGFGGVSATVNGTNATAAQSGQVVTITVPAMATDSIWNSDQVTITVGGVTNPSTSNDYSLEVKTSVENSYVVSDLYPITSAAPLATANFGLTTNEVNEAGDYSFDFTVDANATALNAGSGTITITFPVSSEIPTSIATSEITIDGTPASSITTDPGKRQVVVTTPNTISAGQTASLAMTAAANVVNPKEPATDYTLQVKSSTQSVNSNTSQFTIIESTTTSLSNLSISVSPQESTQPVTWTWSFDTGSQGALQSGVGSIYLNFDQSDFSQVPDPMPTAAFSVNGVQVTTIEYPYNSDSTQVRVVVPSSVTITNNDNVTVTITDAAGIKVDPALAKAKSSGNTSGAVTLAANNYGVDTSAESGNFSTTNPLPISMTSFKVNIPEGTDEPVIRWTTATERNNFGFYIDRTFIAQKVNGQHKAFADTNWAEVEFVEGVGTTTEQSTYEFKDEKLNQAGIYLYRIRQVDNDGNETFYGPIELRYEAPEKFKLAQNYPNPFNPTTNIEYNVAQQSRVRIDVYNVLGQRVQTLVDSQQLAGTYKVQFDGKALSSGVYFVRMMANGNVFTRKMMLMK